MDRPIVYPAALVTDTDTLNGAKFAMAGLAYAMQAVLGTSTVVDGLACAPGSGLVVAIGPGSIYEAGEADASAYGSLGIDATEILKQGLNRLTANLSTPAPATAGQSINYLIEAQQQDVDGDPVPLTYYNSADPGQPFTGSGGDGAAQNTVRQGVCALQAKAGTPAAVGTQTTPAADAGWVGLWVVTVTNGQTQIASGDIAQAPDAPFIGTKLPQALSTLGGVVTGALGVDGALTASGSAALNDVTVTGSTMEVETGANFQQGLSVEAYPAAINAGLTVNNEAATLNGGLDVTGGAVSLPAQSLSGAAIANDTLAGTALTGNTVGNGNLAQMAAGTVKANVGGASATPADVSLSSLAGALGIASQTLNAGAPSVGAAGSVTHSLGAAPTLLQAGIQCVTAEHGYNVGDIVWNPPAGGGTQVAGIQLMTPNGSANTVGWVVTDGQLDVIPAGGDASQAQITYANWNIIIRLALLPA